MLTIRLNNFVDFYSRAVLIAVLDITLVSLYKLRASGILNERADAVAGPAMLNSIERAASTVTFVRPPGVRAFISRKRAGIVGEMMKTEIILENTPPSESCRSGGGSCGAACLQSWHATKLRILVILCAWMTSLSARSLHILWVLSQRRRM